MRDPTPAFDALVDEGVRPRIEHLARIVGEIMGVSPDDRRVRCVGSIQSQAAMYLPNPAAERLGFRFDPTPENVEAAATHIATVSRAGVRAIARECQDVALPQPSATRRSAAHTRSGRWGR